MFSDRNKKGRRNDNSSKNCKNEDINIRDNNRSVEKVPVELGHLLVKMEKRKKASRVLSVISSIIIIAGLGITGYYIYDMFKPIETASISFDDIQDATPDQKLRSEEFKNNPVNNPDIKEGGSSSDSDNSKGKSDSSSKKKKNIQNGELPSYIDNLPEKTTYVFNGGFSNNDSDDNQIIEGKTEKESDSDSDDGRDIIQGKTDDNPDEEDSNSYSSSTHKSSGNSSKCSESSNRKLEVSSSKKDSKSKSVTLTIVGYDGSDILDTKSIKFSGTQTAASVLFSACNKYDIAYKYKGSGSTIYVSSIGGQAEKEHGNGSGWMVRVNGCLIDRSAGAWKVKDDDDIEWFYYSGSIEDIPKE